MKTLKRRLAVGIVLAGVFASTGCFGNGAENVGDGTTWNVFNTADPLPRSPVDELVVVRGGSVDLLAEVRSGSVNHDASFRALFVHESDLTIAPDDSLIAAGATDTTTSVPIRITAKPDATLGSHSVTATVYTTPRFTQSFAVKVVSGSVSFTPNSVIVGTTGTYTVPIRFLPLGDTEGPVTIALRPRQLTLFGITPLSLDMNLTLHATTPVTVALTVTTASQTPGDYLFDLKMGAQIIGTLNIRVAPPTG